jgi:hypothetical protein
VSDPPESATRGIAGRTPVSTRRPDPRKMLGLDRPAKHLGKFLDQTTRRTGTKRLKRNAVLEFLLMNGVGPLTPLPSLSSV